MGAALIFEPITYIRPSLLSWGGTPIHYLYGYVPPNRSRDFKAPDLERGIHFRGVF